MKRIILGFIASFVAFSGAAFAQMSTVVPGEYIVKVRNSSTGVNQQGVRSRLAQRVTMKGAYSRLGMYHVSVRSLATASQEVEDLKQDPDIEYVEPNYIWSAGQTSYSEYASQGYALQTLVTNNWVSTNSTSYSQFSNTVVNNTAVTSAWNISTSLSTNSNKVIVAVVDSGLDRTHPVFKAYKADGTGGSGALWVNTAEANGTPGYDDDGNGFVDDINGWNFVSNSPNVNDDNNHGTHVSGIVVGAGLNIFQRPLPESKIVIMPVKSLAADGTGTTATAIKAIDYAVNNGAQVINNSWGGSNFSKALLDSLTAAYNNGILIVNAAGNYNSNNDSVPMYPANYDLPSVISVASVGSSDTRSSFSNYGKNTVHIASPGESILSTVPGGGYNYMSGTSMASPFVAGVAALALREEPQLTGYQIKQKLFANVDVIAGLANYVSTSGRIDSAKLITAVQASHGETASQPSYVYSASRYPASAESAGGATGCGLVTTAINGGPGAGGANPTAGVVFGLMMLPMAVWFVLRQRAMANDPKNKRRYERFKMQSSIKVMVGDRELVGSMNSISQGGLSFNTDQALEKGGIITMRIQSPDGNEVIEVQGQVVWSEANQAYGVQFANAKQGTLAMIQQWTANLVKS
ncbi:serine protease [Bdellovibrio sp. ZAP7]|uniref:S8 family serine peptidase n=1 Tax=Bdellovibrio sp. ZAP7 TaxID=2231053 RepID=UPI0011599139|nr:S8 family serine peptidase [Bdellovibrio sp. ZAP7]QDK46111.1 serine protease [Bdellovibrio sp. ZAP7]